MFGRKAVSEIDYGESSASQFHAIKAVQFFVAVNPAASVDACDYGKNFLCRAFWPVNIEQAIFVGVGIANVEKAFYVGRNFQASVAPRVARAHSFALRFDKFENFFFGHFVVFLLKLFKFSYKSNCITCKKKIKVQ